ncbi:uncharacterized protein LOC108163999 [Drosophila miranda]|uniref:uncharacterized protein LOC108163999 n=1 Tax=Drosophila miranda TaxID=7229 RepID=UPI0007E661F4|nr:uncharacterized protein LOC108163999 [Drosophila miranda]
MPFPKYSGPHIVGDDGSDESPPFSPPSVLMADEELSESSSEDSSSDDSTESGDSIESTSSERSPVLGENEEKLIASNLMPVVMPPEEDNGPISVIGPTTQQQAAPDGDLANAKPSLPQIGSIMQDAPINGDMANANSVSPQRGSLTEVDSHGYCNTVNKTTASTQTSASDIENDLPSISRRRTMPARFEDPESIGARVAKRGRCSTNSGKSIELAKPLDVTNYFQEVSALFVKERVALLAFEEYCKISNRAVRKAVARSKQRKEQE